MGLYSRIEYLIRFIIFSGYCGWLFLLFVTAELHFYVHTRFHNLVLVTAGVMLLLALTQLAGYFLHNIIALNQGHASDCCGNVDHASAKNTRVLVKKILTYLVFLAPLCFGMISTGGLDPAFAAKRGFEINIANSQAEAGKFMELAIENNYLMVDSQNYTLFAGKLWSNSQGLEGLEVTALGFLFQPSWYELDEEQFIVGRYLITCCAADAMVTGFLAVFPSEFTAAEYDWVQISGKVDNIYYQNEVVGAVIVDIYEVVEPPLDPYLFY